MVGQLKSYASFESPGSSRRHELTTALNGYTSSEFLDNYKAKSKSCNQFLGDGGGETNNNKYHEKISSILNHHNAAEDSGSDSAEMTRKQINAKLLKDRRSFYDNYLNDNESNNLWLSCSIEDCIVDL